MDNRLFRKKNIDKMSSPENLNTFLRVTNPSMWLAFAAIVVLLIGATVWAFKGRIESTVTGLVVSSDTETTCYVSEKNVASIKSGMTVRVGSESYSITGGSPDAIVSDIALSDYGMQVGGFQSGEYVFALTLDRPAESGYHQCTIVIESLRPIDFLG